MVGCGVAVISKGYSPCFPSTQPRDDGAFSLRQILELYATLGSMVLYARAYIFAKPTTMPTYLSKIASETVAAISNPIVAPNFGGDISAKCVL